MTQENFVLDAEAVEADEMYAGTKIHRPKGHGGKRTKPNDIVLGMVERGGGRLKLVPIEDTKKTILQPILERHIAESVRTIYTDGHPIYVYAQG